MSISVDELNRFRQQLKTSPQYQSSLSALRARHEDLLTRSAIYHLEDKWPTQSARQRFSAFQRRAGLLLLLLLIVGLLIWPVPILIALNSFILIFGLAVLCLRIVVLYFSLAEPDQTARAPVALSDDSLPIVTILCPLYQEVDSLPHLIGALEQLDYPAEKLDIKILLEADDHETIQVAKSLCTGAHFDLIEVPPSDPRTKPKACNYALWSARGELLVIYDAEDRPEPDQLRLAAATFAALPRTVACLQARLNYYNRKGTLLTRLFAIEYALLFDLILPGLSRMHAPLPLGGTSNIFRTNVLFELGGWDPHNVTEDADLGLRMAAAGYTSQMLDSTTYEEAVDEIVPWLQQRTRWIKGYLQTWLVHSRHLAKRPWTFFVTLHLLVGGVVMAAMFNPIFWVFYFCWLFGVGDWVIPLFPSPLGELATFALIAGNFFHIWLFMVAPMRRQWHDLVPYAFLAPYYWLMQSFAGYRALWQFIRTPHYWDKTPHGPGQSISDVMSKAKGGGS